MKNEKIFEELSKIDEMYVEEALGYKPKRRISIVKYTVAAAVLVAVCISWAVSVLPQNNHNNSVALVGQRLTDLLDSKITENPVTTQTEMLPDTVKYASLKIPKSDVEIAGIERVNFGSSGDIIAFNESMLNESWLKGHGSIIEGTITSAYLKTYNYEIYDDKFEKNGKLNYIDTHVIYNVKVNRSWYGDYLPGETIKVECENAIGIDNAVLLNVGHTYVFPLYKSTFEITFYGRKIAGGDSRYDSDIRIVYPYHEQIEMTEDGYYLVSTEWKTIAAEGNTVVQMEEPGLYSLRLLNASEFGNGMEKLIEDYLKVTD